MSETQKALSLIQATLSVPKNQHNSFGGYNYRNCEDILEAIKPLLSEHSATLLLTDEIQLVGDRYYVKANAIFSVAGDSPVTVSAYARECLEKKKYDESQLTGSASSYARKYALNGLFAIDDTKDADSKDNREEGKPAFTPDQHDKYMALLDLEDGLGLFLFSQSLTEEARIGLHNSFPKGQITAMKKKARELEATGADICENILNALSGGDIGLLGESIEGMSESTKRLLWGRLNEVERSTLKEMTNTLNGGDND